ncbi:MAG: putrescine aminotransferase, partial [Clostridiales bacterium]|nr:putrescine aminotransferase [Clostridiales bacterium]
MYNYEKNREQIVQDLDRVIKLIHMKADEIPEAEKAQMVKETVEHFNTYVSPGWINYRKCVSSETEGNAVLEWEDGGSYFRGLYDNEKFLDAMGGF